MGGPGDGTIWEVRRAAWLLLKRALMAWANASWAWSFVELSWPCEKKSISRTTCAAARTTGDDGERGEGDDDDDGERGTEK